MSTRCAGAASRIDNSGISDCPPASTLPSCATCANTVHASSIDPGRW